MVPDGSEVLHFPGPIKIKGKRGFLKEEELKLLDLTMFDCWQPDRGTREARGEH